MIQGEELELQLRDCHVRKLEKARHFLHLPPPPSLALPLIPTPINTPSGLLFHPCCVARLSLANGPDSKNANGPPSGAFIVKVASVPYLCRLRSFPPALPPVLLSIQQSVVKVAAGVPPSVLLRACTTWASICDVGRPHGDELYDDLHARELRQLKDH
jgi:hypothetical protein